MKVKPLMTYRRPKYPRLGERIEPPSSVLSKGKHAALVAAIMAVSGTLAGCNTVISPPFGALTGAPPIRQPFSEQEMIQILQYEAEDLGISFSATENTVIKYFGHDIALDLYDEDRQFGVAVVEAEERKRLFESLRDMDESVLLDSRNTDGTSAIGYLEDEQPVNFFFATDFTEHDEDYLRQSFREFIEWLQAEGII